MAEQPKLKESCLAVPWRLLALIVAVSWLSLPAGLARAGGHPPEAAGVPQNVRSIADAAGGSIDLIAPPRGFILLEPQSPPPKGGPYSYAATEPGANWYVVNWNIPGGRLPPFIKRVTKDGVVYSSSAPESSVKIEQLGNGSIQYTLHQDGAALPCTTESGKPLESDLLAGPNLRTVHLPSVSGTSDRAASIPLTSLAKLVAGATVRLHAGQAQPLKDCAVSQGDALIAIILNNRLTKQTLFYKVRLNLACGIQPARRRRLCMRFIRKPSFGYYFHTNPFGADDNLPLLGMDWIRDDESATLHLNLLPRLIKAIQSGPPSMDHNPAHWTVGTLYTGQNIWGNVTMTSSWRDVSLVGVMR